MTSPSASPTLTSIATSMPQTYMMTLKPGCRGDPRMNRAVAAKLKDPSLSLYDALHLGGFTYPRNVDAATIDNDRVTLGQRKNQLNRRLRLAKQSLQKANKDNKDSKDSPANKGKSETAKKPRATLGAGSPLAVAGSYLRQRGRKSGAKTTAAKRSAPAATKTQVMTPRPAKKQCLPVVASNATTVSVSSAKNAEALKDAADFINADLFQSLDMTTESTNLFNALSQNLMAEQQPRATVTPVVDDLSWATIPGKNAAPLATTTQPVEESWWPMLNNGIPTSISTTTAPAPAGGLVDEQVNLVLNDHIFGGAALQDMTNGTAAVNVRCVSTNSFGGCAPDSSTAPTSIAEPNVVFMPQQQQQQQPQQQLQQVQQQPQLVQQAMAGPTDAADPKEELGLRIFQANLQGLYQQSMLAAGFTGHEASHSSQSFHRFAFQAWKSECERLQVLLKDNSVQPHPTGV